MRAVVTGAAGFIGSHLCRRLVAEGDDVVGLDDLSEGSLENLKDVPEVTFIQGDLRDIQTVRNAARGAEVIFHQGAIRSVPRSLEVPVLTTQVNVIGTLHALMAAQGEGARLVYASSSSLYGKADRYPVSEDSEVRPQSPYAASKLGGEFYCRAWWRGLGLPTISLRYFNAYGPGQDPASEYAAVIPRFITACLNGQRPTIYGDGEQSRDFTYIDDVVSANLLAARAGEDAFGKAVNVGGGATPTSVNRLLALIAELTGAPAHPIYEPERVGDIRMSQADVSLARRFISYEPRVSIEEGLRRTVEWFAQPGAGS
jgi:UDP-glucose 4-epimerase